MFKKIAFILLVFALMIAGALVSMAIEDEELILSRFALNNLPSGFFDTDGAYGEQEDEFSYESVIEMYSSLFFDAENKTDVDYIKDIVIEKYSASKEDIHDYYVYATPSENAQLEKGNTIVVMVFIQSGDGFELLSDPVEFNKAFTKHISISLPNVGNDNPNCIRIIAFLKNDYKELRLDNIQIYDTEIIIVEQSFDFHGSLKSTQDILKTFNTSIIPE